MSKMQLPEDLDDFSIEAIRLFWSQDPPPSYKSIFKKIDDKTKKGKTVDDVGPSIDKMTRGFKRFKKRSEDVVTDLVMITYGEHALEVGKAVNSGYSSKEVPPKFEKSLIMAERPCLDVQLTSGKIVKGVLFDNVMFEHEFRTKCCFEEECIATGYILQGGRWADPVRENCLCCSFCFNARVLPHTLPIKEKGKESNTIC